MKSPCTELLLFCIVLGICSARRRCNKPGYCRAAVLELKQYGDEISPEAEIINKNLEKYTVAASLAAQNGVDLVLYPEKGMFKMKQTNPLWYLKHAEDVPHGKERANPCNDAKFSNSPILKNLSCTARTYNVFVVATLIDVKKCEVHENCKDEINKNSCVTDILDCPITGEFKFNALVAFNRRGTLVARYYKRHPFSPLEIGITTPKYPEPAHFKDRGCKYISEIGFGILFNDTVLDIQKYPQTSALLYANWWYDHTPPHFFSVPIEQAWSFTNKVTILSSDVQAPNSGSLGSGIYIPDTGAVVYSYNPDGKSKLLISNFPKCYSGSRLDKNKFDSKFLYIGDDNTVSELNGEEPRDFKEECKEELLGVNPISLTDYRCHSTNVDQYTFVKLNKTEDYINICSNNFCCSLEYQAESMNENFYFGVSGYRLKFYDIWYFGIQSCMLARCEPVAGKPCRNFLLKSNTKFLNLKITGHFDSVYNYFHLLHSDLRLPDREEWNFENKSQLSYQNLKGGNMLYADIFGRIFEKDGLLINIPGIAGKVN